MRALIVLIALSIAGCATTATDTAQSAIRTACNQHSNCFSQNAVRSFEILDDTTLVAFVGAERCPYLVRLDGFFCNLRMSAYVGFRDFDGRICNLDRSFVVGGPFAREDEYCEVRQVKPLNDDELLETFASYGLVEPLPARGSGELEVIEAAGEEPAEPQAEEAPATPEAESADPVSESG
jgi:hypothetical protein